MTWLNVCIALFALVMAGGGINGYVSTGSLASLWAGVISGVLLAVALVLAPRNPRAGYGLATLVSVALLVVFAERFAQTGKPMPSLALVGLCALMLALLVIGHFLSQRKPSVKP